MEMRTLLRCHLLPLYLSLRYRICLNDDNLIQLDCHCGDELSLVHIECANEWFSLKRTIQVSVYNTICLFTIYVINTTYILYSFCGYIKVTYLLSKSYLSYLSHYFDFSSYT